MRSLIRRLRNGFPPAGGELTDERLLEDFLARRAAPSEAAEDAFAAIVRRHGPMVRGVCRRVLRNDADADDAFQAVFVVLIRKAESVRPGSRLGNWLYGVAVNVARRGRDAIARRRTQELTVEPEASAVGEPDFGELRAVIDQELSGLPDAYRAAVVACDLEGATRSEAAGRLGWSEGTVASRLARGRAILADRLARRGIALPAAGLVAVLGTSTAEALPPVNYFLLISSPPPAAEALATEAMKAMTTSKLKGMAVVLLAVIGLAGAGTATVWACGGFIPRPNPPASDPKPFPDRSVETTEAPATGPAPAWDRPLPKEMPAFADKPAADGLGVAGIAKPAHFVMVNPAKDITIVSDRHEKFVEFFRRQPVLIAGVPQALRDKMLYDAKGVDKMSFVENASFNTDGLRAAVYGASVKLAPVPPNSPVAQMLEMTDAKHPVVFVRDPGDKDLWHAVGYTRRASFAFFASKERVSPDDFAPVDLLYHEKDKKGGVPPKPPEIKPTRLESPSKSIVVASDREESIPEFFRRQRVTVGSLDGKAMELLLQGKGTPGKVFVGGTTTNDGEVFYGSFVQIAPPSPEAAKVFAELAKDGQKATRATVVFLPDAPSADVFHPVGYSTIQPSFFFERNRKTEGEDFSPADLVYAGNVGKAPEPPVKQFVLKNPAGDIVVLSDREETLPQFFRRQQVVVGPLHAQTVATLAAGRFDPHRMTLESTMMLPSYNDRPFQKVLAGIRVMVPTGRMLQMVAERASAAPADQPFAILVPDATERGAYRLVGLTDRKNVPFFADTAKGTGDGFAPADLLHMQQK